MKRQTYVTISTTILQEQNEWLSSESNHRALPKAALLREAIELLKEKTIKIKRKQRM